MHKYMDASEVALSVLLVFSGAALADGFPRTAFSLACVVTVVSLANIVHIGVVHVLPRIAKD